MAANTAYAWEQNPVYIAACQTLVPLGGPTAYNPPRRPGMDAGDHTDFQVGQFDWSVNNLPEILYQALPRADWDAFKQKPVPQKLDANGAPMWERWPEDPLRPRKLRYFPLLANIDQICTQEHPLIMEAWRRLDPRIKWEDITMRMQWFGRPNHNAINMDSNRVWRPKFCILSWRYKGQILSSAPNSTVYNSLSPAQRQHNTTRGSTPGLINPALGPGSPSVPLPAMGADEGFVKRKPVPNGFVGLTRQIMPAGTQVAQSSGSGTQQGVSTNAPVPPQPAPIVAPVGQMNPNTGRSTRSGGPSRQGTLNDNDSEPENNDGKDGDDKDSDTEVVVQSGAPRTTRRPTQAPRAQLTNLPGASFPAPSDPYTDSANEWLAVHGRSPLRAYEDSLRVRRAAHNRASSEARGNAGTLAPVSGPLDSGTVDSTNRAPTCQTGGLLMGYSYPTALFGQNRLGTDPFTQPTPRFPVTAAADPESRAVAENLRGHELLSPNESTPQAPASGSSRPRRRSDAGSARDADEQVTETHQTSQ